ncbi:hypothetical protein [Xanthomonas euroxanthea]|uniref:hypothetical protein n=1 Tax=Xanthomonas euroxanthea TaxID=2259622 RepID=UPI0011C03726|nr:hypothetical protein [Xanthomonas euroxanthea]
MNKIYEALLGYLRGEVHLPIELSEEIIGLLKLINSQGNVALADIPPKHADDFYQFAGVITCFSDNGRNSMGCDSWLDYLSWLIKCSTSELDPSGPCLDQFS